MPRRLSTTRRATLAAAVACGMLGGTLVSVGAFGVETDGASQGSASQGTNSVDTSSDVAAPGAAPGCPPGTGLPLDDGKEDPQPDGAEVQPGTATATAEPTPADESPAPDRPADRPAGTPGSPPTHPDVPGIGFPTDEPTDPCDTDLSVQPDGGAAPTEPDPDVTDADGDQASDGTEETEDPSGDPTDGPEDGDATTEEPEGTETTPDPEDADTGEDEADTEAPEESGDGGKDNGSPDDTGDSEATPDDSSGEPDDSEESQDTEESDGTKDSEESDESGDDAEDAEDGTDADDGGDDTPFPLPVGRSDSSDTAPRPEAGAETSTAADQQVQAQGTSRRSRPSTRTPGDTNAITRPEVITRAISWVVQKVPYSQTRWWTDQNGTYRQDCSGYVSMVWRTDQRINYWTGNLATISDRISSKSMKPGDILLLPGKHTVIFLGWANTAKTKFHLFEQYRTGTPARFLRNASLSYYLDRGYGAYQYENIAETVQAESTVEDTVERSVEEADLGAVDLVADSSSMTTPGWDPMAAVAELPSTEWDPAIADDYTPQAAPPAGLPGTVTPDAGPQVPVEALIEEQRRADAAALASSVGGRSGSGYLVIAGLGLLFLAVPIGAAARRGAWTPSSTALPIDPRDRG